MVRRRWRSTAALRSAVRSPADFVLAARIAAFVIAAPRELGRADVASYLEAVRRAPRPRAGDLDASQQRVVRLRNGVLSLPWFWRRNNCYVRALALCRFLDAGGGVVRMHIGIEQRKTDANLHGHAWVTVDGTLIEGPEGVLLERLREIPVHARR